MDALYKNIHTSDYTISVLFAGIVISQTPNDAPWTESIKNTAISPYTVDSGECLNKFTAWINTNSSHLPERDHTMLFTRYDLSYRGSTSNLGLAWTGVICGTYSQSIVQDGYNFIIITVAAHELGHSLSAQHDGTTNLCSSNDAHIMASSSKPQQGPQATNPWKFSSCSTDYFTSQINTLESSGESGNCLKTLGSNFDHTALAPYDEALAGQVYDADAQCVQMNGIGSYMCRGKYGGNYESICNVLWCSNPEATACYKSIAGEGTLCGNKKWCVSGVCTPDIRAPAGNENCLYGDRQGQIFFNGWTCAEMYINDPRNCVIVPVQCCASCYPETNSVAATTEAHMTNKLLTTTKYLKTTESAASTDPPTTTESITTTETLTTTESVTSTEPQTTTESVTSTEPLTTTELVTTTEPQITTESITPQTTTESVTTTESKTTTESVTATETQTTTESIAPQTTTESVTSTEPKTTTESVTTTETVTTTESVISTEPQTTTESITSTKHLTTTESVTTTEPQTTTESITPQTTTESVTTTEPKPTTESVTTTETQTSTESITPQTTTESVTSTEPKTTTESVTTTETLTTTESVTSTEPQTTTESTTLTEHLTTTESVTTTEPQTTPESVRVTTTEPQTLTESVTSTDPLPTTESVATTELQTTTESVTTTQHLTTTESVTTIEPLKTTESVTTTEALTTAVTTTEPLTTTESVTTTEIITSPESVNTTQLSTTKESAIKTYGMTSQADETTQSTTQSVETKDNLEPLIIGISAVSGVIMLGIGTCIIICCMRSKKSSQIEDKTNKSNVYRYDGHTNHGMALDSFQESHSFKESEGKSSYSQPVDPWRIPYGKSNHTQPARYLGDNARDAMSGLGGHHNEGFYS